MSTLLEQASLVMIPSGYKEDVVYSQIPTSGAGDLSFTRASNGTRINSAGLVEVCPWNFILQSQSFNIGSWGYTNYTLTPNSTTAPDGTLTADLFTLNNGIVAGAGSAIDQGLSQLGQITLSVYFKNNNSTGKYVIQDGNGRGIEVNVVTLAFTNLSSAVGSVESVGNGWYRIITTITQTSSYYFYSYQDGMTGDGSKGIYLWGAQLNIGSTAKPYFPTTDRLNVPRLTYQNGGGGCPSLLLEKQSTNLVTYSEQLDNAAWSTVGSITITANNATSPDGTQNADLFSQPSSSAYMYQNLGVFSGTYTTSIFVKKGSQSSIAFGIVAGGFTGGMSVKFNLDTETFSTPTNYANWTSLSATYQNYGNGWYRLNLTGTTATSTTYFHVLGSLLESFAVNAYVYGAQVEASSYPTSYIPTTSSSATRVADDITNTFLQSGGFLGSNTGAMFVSGTAYNLLGNVVLNFVLTADNNTTKSFLFDTSSNQIRLRTWDASSNLQSLTSGTITGNYKLCVSWTSSSIKFFVNGSLIGTISQTTYPYTTIKPESTSYSNNIWGEVVFFPTNIADADAIALTTI